MGDVSSSAISDDSIKKPADATDKSKYDMSKKGMGLIFNHYGFYESFVEKSKKEIETSLQNTLEKLNFGVKICDNYTANGIQYELGELEKLQPTISCILIMVITKGNKHHLYAADRKYPVEDLWESLIGKFVGIPKLFFIQTMPPQQKNVPQIVTDGVLDNIFKRTPEKIIHTLPVMADFLQYRSSYDAGNCPTTFKPMWFITSLCEVVENDSKGDLNILQLLTMVNKRLAAECADEELFMPQIVSMLTKILKFKINEKLES